MLKMDVEYGEGVLYVKLEGSLTAKNSYKINDYLVPIVLKHNIKYIVYNLRSLLNIDLKGRDAILNSKYAVKKNNGKILFCKVNKSVFNFFKGMNIRMIDKEKDVLKYIGA